VTGECGRCRKHGELRTLFARGTNGVALHSGNLGPRCFYIVARQVANNGYQPEHHDSRPVVLRGGR
jgi:hypothetical protein